MNLKALQNHIDKNKETFQTLAKCGSVSELIIKLNIYGKNWNRWSWSIFIYFLQTTDNTEECHMMFKDIIDTIDNTNTLDSIFTNKIVVKSIIQIIDLHNTTVGCTGLLCILAHIFAKFPTLWNVNWMFIRHTTLKKKTIRTHRLKYFLPNSINYPIEYFESKQFTNDFISQYQKFEKI